jgi:hypothetical protein
LGALALTYYNKNFIAGKADRGSLQSAFKVSVAGLFFVILVFLISPALSNYGLMNLFLFAELFAFGYYSAALGGQNLHAGAAMFFIVATVGLDAEKPVAVQTVFGSYFGVVLPIFIAAIVGRLFWPVLPEAELRKRFIEFFSQTAWSWRQGFVRSSDFDPDRSRKLGERHERAPLSGKRSREDASTNRDHAASSALIERSGTCPVAGAAGEYRACSRSEYRESKRGIPDNNRSFDYGFSGRINSSYCAINESGTREFPKHLAGSS